MKANRIFLIICLLFPGLLSVADNQEKLVKVTWELGYSKDSNTLPSEWIPAIVPGAVQLDIARAEKYQPFYYAEHWKDYLWMEDMYYTYRTSFNKPDLSDGKRLMFISLGIDYEFEIIT